MKKNKTKINEEYILYLYEKAKKMKDPRKKIKFIKHIKLLSKGLPKPRGQSLS